MLKRALLSFVLMIAVGCAVEREPHEAPETAPTATAALLTALIVAEPRVVHAPCPALPSAAPLVATSAEASDPDRPKIAKEAPKHVPGLGTLRLGVMHSVKEGVQKKVELERLLTGRGWRLQVWRTRSGKDPKVKARVHAIGVDPGAGEALCAWLDSKGWQPGAAPCAMR